MNAPKRNSGPMDVDACVAWLSKLLDEVKADPEKYPQLAGFPLDELVIDRERIAANLDFMRQFIAECEIDFARDDAIYKAAKRAGSRPTYRRSKPRFDD